MTPIKRIPVEGFAISKAGENLVPSGCVRYYELYLKDPASVYENCDTEKMPLSKKQRVGVEAPGLAEYIYSGGGKECGPYHERGMVDNIAIAEEGIEYAIYYSTLDTRHPSA